MEKIFALVVSLFFLLTSVNVGVAVPLNLKIERVVQTKVRAHSLYQFVFAQLQAYYGRNNFEDPQYKTGWYRVDAFVRWVQEHDEELLTDINARRFSSLQVLWIYLGARYIASVYGVDADFSLLHIQSCAEEYMACARMNEQTILFDSTEHTSAPAAITLGIHEGTHLLPALSGKEQIPSLSELAAFYSQHQYGLPVKIEEASHFGYGVRDIRLTAQRKGFALIALTEEYFLHIVGLALLPELSPRQLLTSYNDLSEPSDFNLATSLIYWHALRQGQLLLNNQSYTDDQYIKRLLGDSSANQTMYAKTHEFLTALEENLPPQITQKIQACFPITTLRSSCVTEVKDWLHKNSYMVIESVMQALQAVHAPSEPPVPHGYL